MPTKRESFSSLNSAMETYHFTRTRVASFVSSEPTRSTVSPPGPLSPTMPPSPNWSA